MKSGMNALRLAVIGAGLGLLAACGGGGGGGGGTGTSVGVLLDAEVQGVSYVASPSNLSGVTNEKGEFNYRPGDTVTFKVGGIVIGSAPATGVLTPRDLAENMDLPIGVKMEDAVTNIAIFLQTFDDDGEPSNGINILPAVREDAEGVSLDFAQVTTSFTGDAALTTLAGSTYTVVDAQAALDHVAKTMEKQLVGSWRLLDNGAGTYFVFSFFPDGTYIGGFDQRGDANCTSGIERGTYSISAVEGTLTIDSVDIDSTGPSGECGLFENGNSAGMIFSFPGATSLVIEYEDPSDPADAGTLTFSKVVNDGVNGSWVQYDGNGSPISVLTLMADGKYTQVEADLAGSKNGVEFGTWSRNASTGAISSTSIVDTNQQSGPSNGTGISIDVEGFGFLEVSDVSDPAPTLLAPHPYQLKLAGNTADSRNQLIYSACPSTPGGWLFTFGTSNFTVEGSDHWTDCELAPYDGTPETWVYTEFDAPFNCGDAVCDWYEMNKVIAGIDNDGRGFTSTYTHVPGSWTYDVVKELTSGAGAGTSFSESIVLGNYVLR